VNHLGIMQGRLLPPVDGEIQAFPGERWRDEFLIAKELNLDLIEMIFDVDDPQINPLFTSDGIHTIQEIIQATGIGVKSVCADYFMKYKLINNSEDETVKNLNTLVELINRLDEIELRTIVLPFVDNSEIKDSNELMQLRKLLESVFDKTGNSSICLSLESSLPAKMLREFLEDINHPRLKINYDTGNSTSLGYNLYEEICTLGPWILDVHIKDRLIHGPTVPLGEGDTDFEATFRALRKINYNSFFILQAQRGSDGEKNTIRRYENFLQNNYIPTLQKDG